MFQILADALRCSKICCTEHRNLVIINCHTSGFFHKLNGPRPTQDHPILPLWCAVMANNMPATIEAGPFSAQIGTSVSARCFVNP